jgi:hypothetical protein
MCYYGGIRRSRLPCLLDQPSYGTCWSTWNTLWLRLSFTPSLSSSASSSYGLKWHRYWTGTGFFFLIVSSDHSGQDRGFYTHIFSEPNSFFVAENCSMPTKHLWPRAASFIGEFKHWRSLFGLVFFKSFWKDLFFALSPRSGLPALQLRLSEDFVLSTASVFRTKLNRCLQFATDIAVCKDLKLCIKVLLLPSSVPWMCYFIPPKVVLNLRLCIVCMAGSWSTVDYCKIGVMVALPHTSLDR